MHSRTVQMPRSAGYCVDSKPCVVFVEDLPRDHVPTGIVLCNAIRCAAYGLC